MADIKPMTAIQAKWQQRASVSQQAYADGVSNPRSSWADGAARANDAWKAGIQAAAAANRFANGVRAAGDAKWSAMARSKGPSRWAEGISISGDAYARGFAPYHQAIQNIQLSPRGPRGDARNYKRVQEIGDALHQVRVQQGK